MRWLFLLLVGVLAVSDIMSWPLSLAPGLSVKNAALYLLLFALMFRTALRGLPTTEMPALHAVFAVWVFYATASWLIAALLIRYPYYDLIQNGITLKAELFDPVIFFLVAFHGLRDTADVKAGLKALAAAVGIANFVTLTDVVGLTHLGITIGAQGVEAGRVFGVFGHANDTASMIDGLLPLSVAVALGARGISRALWWAGAVSSLAVLLLTVSRGAYVGLVVGAIWAAWLCRRLIPIRRLTTWAVSGAVAIVVVIAAASLAVPYVADLIEHRLLGGGRVGVDELSSGRTIVWMSVIERMLENPITLLTGYGWDVYWVMPFRFATHNFYLFLWFNLGLAGLGAFVAVLAIGASTARRAAATAAHDLRPYLIAFVFGIAMLAIALLFANLSVGWAYVWLYIGVSVRAAVLALESPGALSLAAAEPARTRLQAQPVNGLARSRPR